MMGEIEEELELIGVYFGASGLVEGAGTGARILKEEAMLSGAFLDGGDVTLDESAETSVLEQVIEVSELTRERSASVLERGDVPFVIGGDHSTAFGNIAAACEHFGPEGVGVVYLDAHCDMNTPETSPTGNLHGMPMAALMGYGDPRWCAVARRWLLPENVLLLGARSIDPGERVFVREHGIKVVPLHPVPAVAAVPEPVEGPVVRYFDKLSTAQAHQPVLALIDRFIEERGIRHLHLSIDIDVLDPELVPGTGVPVPNGISEETYMAIIRHVAALPILCSLDIVEYIPSLDKGDITKSLCLETIRQIGESRRGMRIRKRGSGDADPEARGGKGAKRINAR